MRNFLDERHEWILGGHLKTGQTWSLQNRPTERTQNKSIYTLERDDFANNFAWRGCVGLY